jgi:hypothetical protein
MRLDTGMLVVGAILGYQVRATGVDKKLAAKLEAFWEDRIRKDAEIARGVIRSELANVGTSAGMAFHSPGSLSADEGNEGTFSVTPDCNVKSNGWCLTHEMNHPA